MTSKKQLNKEILKESKFLIDAIKKQADENDINYFYGYCMNKINDGKSTHPINFISMFTNPDSTICQEASITPPEPLIEGLKNHWAGKKVRYIVSPLFMVKPEFINDGLALMDFYFKMQDKKTEMPIYEGTLIYKEKEKKFYVTGFHGGMKVPLFYGWILPTLND